MASVAAVSTALPSQITREYAQELTDRFRDQMQAVRREIGACERTLDEIVQTEAWIPLGYASLDDYAHAEFKDQMSERHVGRQVLRALVKQSVAAALPAGSPPVEIPEHRTRGLSRRRKDPERVAAVVREMTAKAPSEDHPAIVQAALRQVAEEARRPQIVDAVTAPAVAPEEPDDEDAAPALAYTETTVADEPAAAPVTPGQSQMEQQPWERLTEALDIISVLSQIPPHELWASIPEGFRWWLRSLDAVRYYLDAVASARDLSVD
jgi:hypothetical protein